MLTEDKTAVICDLAETYQIYDYRRMPARIVATLACGLKADSRIKTKMAGIKETPSLLLLNALIVDELRAFRWGLLGDKNKKPPFVVDILENGIPQKDTAQGFNTVEEFEAARAEIIKKVQNG